MSLFRRKRIDSVLLLDIGSGSVGAAYLSLAKGTRPTLHYGVRVPRKESAELVALVKEAVKALVAHGSPMLRDATGNGRADTAFVAVASPWQKTHVEKRVKESESPFTVTRAMLDDLAKANEALPEGYDAVDSAIIATSLNGYDISDPVGKRAKSLDAVVMTASIERKAKDAIGAALKSETHIAQATYIPFPWISYSTLSVLYPHEKDFLIMDAAGLATDVALVARGRIACVASCGSGVAALAKKGIVAGTESIEEGIHVKRDTKTSSVDVSGAKDWLASVVSCFKEISERQALPRTLFLLADEAFGQTVKTLLSDPSVRSLWLSDEPLSVIIVSPSQMQNAIVPLGEGTADIFLMLAAYHAARLYTEA